MSETYPGWWATKEKLDLKAAFTSTTDQAKRKEIWSKLQSLMYDQVPIVKNVECSKGDYILHKNHQLLAELSAIDRTPE